MLNAFKRLLAILSFVAVATSASAQATKINLGYVPAGDWLPALVAKDKGYFDKRHLDVSLTKVAIISNIPSAILSGSLQVGVSTPTVLIDAADAGLPLVGIAGGTRFVKNPSIFSVVVRQGVVATSAKDLEGKRVGVPGVRSIADVLFRKWLLDKGVNPARVTIVEAPFPQMKDLLKGGTIDAVAVLEPFRSRIVADNTGFRLADYVAEVNPDVLGGVWIAQRQWASANPKAMTAFRESLAEAIEFIKSNTEEARAIESKYLGFSTPVLLPYSLSVSHADLEIYVKYARDVGYLTKQVDVGQMLAR
jgi:NitT/TauT family transport system substrate-binding protein